MAWLTALAERSSSIAACTNEQVRPAASKTLSDGKGMRLSHFIECSMFVNQQKK
jgi:hypothetical protein